MSNAPPFLSRFNPLGVFGSSIQVDMGSSMPSRPELSSGNFSSPKSSLPDLEVEFGNAFPGDAQIMGLPSSTGEIDRIKMGGMGSEMAAEMYLGESDIQSLGVSDMGYMAYATQSGYGYNRQVGLQYQTSKIELLRSTALPRRKEHRISKALLHAEQDELVGGLIDTKVEVAMTGMMLYGKPIGFTAPKLNKKLSSGKKKVAIASADPNADADGTQSNDDIQLTPEELAKLQEQHELQQTLNDIQLKWNLRGVISALLRDWFSTDSMILCWRIDPTQTIGESSSDSLPPEPGSKEELLPGLVDVTALSPGDVVWDNSLGQDILLVKIPLAIRDRILKAINQPSRVLKQKSIQQLLSEGIAKKWIQAVIDGEDMVMLDRQDGDNWIIRTRARPHFGLAVPSMFRIFLSIEIRKSFTEGDFAAAFMFKNFILHAKLGESIVQGPMAGQRINWAKKEDTKSFMNLMSDVSRVSKLATNHTVEFTFVYPPVEMFSPDRYAAQTISAFNWAGVTPVFYNGSGGKYASGFLSIKRLLGHLSYTRQELRDMFVMFFGHPTIKGRFKVPDETIVSVAFDENPLKEPAQLLNELKFMFENGCGDPPMALQELGRDPDRVRRSKLHSDMENNSTKVWEPIVSPTPFAGNDNPSGDTSTAGKVSSGKKKKNASKGGRPANPGTTPNEETRTQPPSGRATSK